MKIRHRLCVGLVAAFAVSLASVAVSAGAAETPFKGTVHAVETGTVVFPTRFLDRQGTVAAAATGGSHYATSELAPEAELSLKAMNGACSPPAPGDADAAG